VEVKSGTNRNLKSLRSYADKYKPEIIFRLSPRNMIQSGDFVNIPLYAVKGLLNIIHGGNNIDTSEQLKLSKTP
jgi:hypothetical protein